MSSGLMELQCGFEDSLITMIFGVGAAVAAFPPVMDLCVSFLGRKGAVIAGGAIFCLGSGLQALVARLQVVGVHVNSVQPCFSTVLTSNTNELPVRVFETGCRCWCWSWLCTWCRCWVPVLVLVL